jgi:hypothetical protein
MTSTFGILLTKRRGEGVSFIHYDYKADLIDLVDLSDLIKRLSKKEIEEIEEILLSRDNLELFPVLLFILLTKKHHITPLGFLKLSLVKVKRGTQILIELS